MKTSLRQIIISINPKYVKKIITGEKKYEYRTVVAKYEIDKIFIYETTPVKKVVAEAEILDILELPPSKMWEYTKSQSGVSEDFFSSYFKNREQAYAYKLGKINVYKTPIALASFGIKNAPQSFVYVRKQSLIFDLF